MGIIEAWVKSIAVGSQIIDSIDVFNVPPNPKKLPSRRRKSTTSKGREYRYWNNRNFPIHLDLLKSIHKRSSENKKSDVYFFLWNAHNIWHAWISRSCLSFMKKIVAPTYLEIMEITDACGCGFILKYFIWNLKFLRTW